MAGKIDMIKLPAESSGLKRGKKMSGLVEYLKANFSEAATSAVTRLIGAALIIVLGFWVVKRLAVMFSKSKLVKKLDRSAANFMHNLASIVLRALIIFMAAAVLGVPTASIVTLIGSFGLAVGLAMQGSLSNLAGGVLIIFFKTIRIGDYIELADGNAGTVTNIGIIYTTIKTIGNNLVVIPNGSLSNQVIINYSCLPKRRLDMKFSVAYDSDLKLVKRLLYEAAAAHPLVDRDEEIFVRLFSIGEGSLTFVLRAWCKTEDYWTVYYDLNESIKELFDKNGVWIPFKEMDINIRNADAARLKTRAGDAGQ